MTRIENFSAVCVPSCERVCVCAFVCTHLTYYYLQLTRKSNKGVKKRSFGFKSCFFLL